MWEGCEEVGGLGGGTRGVGGGERGVKRWEGWEEVGGV